jgi:hypothetical protein
MDIAGPELYQNALSIASKPSGRQVIRGRHILSEDALNTIKGKCMREHTLRIL